MKKFSKHLFKIFTPILFICVIFYFVNKYEIIRIHNISKSQKILFNPNYNQSLIDFKLKHNKEEISIIGSSRTAGFEDKMFANQSVYNYSLIVNSIQDIFNLIVELNLQKNDTLIIGLDQWNFNKNYKLRHQKKFTKNNIYFPYILFNQNSSFENIYLLGIKSICNFSGFRNDGSYFYGKRFISPKNKLEDFNFRDTFERIENGNRRFEYGEYVDSDQTKIIEELLFYLKNKEVKLYAFFPPFAPSVYKKMNKKNYNYIKSASIELSKIFMEFGFTFKDFTGLKVFGDRYYIDGFHSNRNINYYILKELNLNVNKNFDNNYEVESNELILLESYFDYLKG